MQVTSQRSWDGTSRARWAASVGSLGLAVKGALEPVRPPRSEAAHHA